MFYEFDNLSIRDLQSLADNSDPAAQFSLASRLSEGAGVKCDQKKADEYDLKAAKAGYAPAQLYLAVDEDTSEDEQKRWYRESVSQGWPKRAVNSGNSLACFQYGELLMSGLHGVDVDFEKVYQISSNSSDWRLMAMHATAALALENMDDFAQAMRDFIEHPDIDNAYYYYLNAELLTICREVEAGEYYMLKAAEKGYESAVEKLFEREASLN